MKIFNLESLEQLRHKFDLVLCFRATFDFSYTPLSAFFQRVPKGKQRRYEFQLAKKIYAANNVLNSFRYPVMRNPGKHFKADYGVEGFAKRQILLISVLLQFLDLKKISFAYILVTAIFYFP